MVKVVAVADIREYVFLPEVFLMFAKQMHRFMAIRWMNESKHPLHKQAALSYPLIFDTLFEADAEKELRLPDEPIDFVKVLDENTKVDKREIAALAARSKRFR